MTINRRDSGLAISLIITMAYDAWSDYDDVDWIDALRREICHIKARPADKASREFTPSRCFTRARFSALLIDREEFNSAIVYMVCSVNRVRRVNVSYYTRIKRRWQLAGKLPKSQGVEWKFRDFKTLMKMRRFLENLLFSGIFTFII